MWERGTLPYQTHQPMTISTCIHTKAHPIVSASTCSSSRHVHALSSQVFAGVKGQLDSRARHTRLVRSPTYYFLDPMLLIYCTPARQREMQHADLLKIASQVLRPAGRHAMRMLSYHACIKSPDQSANAIAMHFPILTDRDAIVKAV